LIDIALATAVAAIPVPWLSVDVFSSHDFCAFCAFLRLFLLFCDLCTAIRTIR
jgi:hypothetical protein